MRALLITVALLAGLPATANADGLGSLQDSSGKWGANVKCSTGYDSEGGFVVETCRTLNYCRMSIVRNDLRVGRRCTRVAPWSLRRWSRTG